MSDSAPPPGVPPADSAPPSAFSPAISAPPVVTASPAISTAFLTSTPVTQRHLNRDAVTGRFSPKSSAPKKVKNSSSKDRRSRSRSPRAKSRKREHAPVSSRRSPLKVVSLANPASSGVSDAPLVQSGLPSSVSPSVPSYSPCVWSVTECFCSTGG